MRDKTLPKRRLEDLFGRVDSIVKQLASDGHYESLDKTMKETGELVDTNVLSTAYSKYLWNIYGALPFFVPVILQVGKTAGTGWLKGQTFLRFGKEIPKGSVGRCLGLDQRSIYMVPGLFRSQGLAVLDESRNLPLFTSYCEQLRLMQGSQHKDDMLLRMLNALGMNPAVDQTVGRTIVGALLMTVGCVQKPNEQLKEFLNEPFFGWIHGNPLIRQWDTETGPKIADAITGCVAGAKVTCLRPVLPWRSRHILGDLEGRMRKSTKTLPVKNDLWHLKEFGFN